VNYALLGITLPLVTAVVIAIWQHRSLRRYRQADRQADAERVEQEKIQQARRDGRARWEPAFRDADAILKKLQDIESEVRAQGPVDPDFVTRADLKRIQWQLKNVADLCPEVLHGPIRTVASHVAKFSGIRFPPDAEVTDAYGNAFSSTPPGTVPSGIMASQLGARAIEQYSEVISAKTSRPSGH